MRADPVARKFGANRGVRYERDWSQTQLAAHAGMRGTVVAGIERGVRLRVLLRLARALDMEPAGCSSGPTTWTGG